MVQGWKEAEREIGKVLRDLGVNHWERVQRGKHLGIEWKSGKDRIGIIIPASASDYRALANAKANVRNLMKQRARISSVPSQSALQLSVDKAKARDWGWPGGTKFKYFGGISGLTIQADPNGDATAYARGNRLIFSLSCGKLIGIDAVKMKYESIPLIENGARVLKTGGLPPELQAPKKGVKVHTTRIKEDVAAVVEAAKKARRPLDVLMFELIQIGQMLRQLEEEIASQSPGFEVSYCGATLTTHMDMRDKDGKDGVDNWVENPKP